MEVYSWTRKRSITDEIYKKMSYETRIYKSKENPLMDLYLIETVTSPYKLQKLYKNTFISLSFKIS